MSSTEEKNKLLSLKYSLVFELLQKEKQMERKRLAAQFSRMGTLHSGAYVKAIMNLELKNIKTLIEARFKHLLEVFYKDSEPWTNEDEEFLLSNINELFTARQQASRKSIEELFRQMRAPSFIEEFDREASQILSSIRREIQIAILENRTADKELPDKDTNELLLMDEDDRLEFKSTFQWDKKNTCKNEKLRMESIRTIAAFNNTGGGYLIIGVDDNKKIYGLEKDYSLISKNNRDGFMLLLVQEIENRISRSILPKIDISFQRIEDKDICRIRVCPGDDGVWIEENGKEMFYIRAQNSTRALSPKDSANYIRNKWRLKK